MVDSLKHPRRDLAGQLNPGGGLTDTSPRCSRTAPLADGASAPAPASPWLELARAEALAWVAVLARVGAGDDVLKVPAQPASAGSSVSSAATTSAERPAERGAIQLRPRTGVPPNQPMSQLSALSAPTGIPLAKRLPQDTPSRSRGPPGTPLLALRSQPVEELDAGVHRARMRDVDAQVRGEF